MVLDDAVLTEAKDARNQVIDLEFEADRARLHFQHAIRRLHARGGSLREIAEALGLSHQRVHQIVEGAEGKVALKNARSEISCSFCGLYKSKAQRIVAGPNVFICDRCISLASEVVREGAARTNERVTIEPTSDVGKRCNFCGRKCGTANAMATFGDVGICRDCLGLCHDILLGNKCP